MSNHILCRINSLPFACALSFPKSPLLHQPYNDENVQKRVHVLQRLQRQYDELTAKCLAGGVSGLSKAEMESQYADCYLKRFNLVNGVVDVDDIKIQKSRKAPIHQIEEGQRLSGTKSQENHAKDKAEAGFAGPKAHCQI